MTVENRYQTAVEYLFGCIPSFEKEGVSGYKPGLERVSRLSAAFGSPEKKLRKIVHVAGTNGKGSTAHSVAAILQSAGYRVGLFTSPHLVDFRERIRVDGRMISCEEVVDFVERFRSGMSGIEPSFFELTTVMAFEYFVRNDVDVAVVEVGLGGRLDSTNIVDPTLCIITNISLDHTMLLGSTSEAIAREKAGIIKPGVPVVIGEADDSLRKVFSEVARAKGAPIIFAEDVNPIESATAGENGWVYATKEYGQIRGQLAGICQPKNAATILCAVGQLSRRGMNVPREAIAHGMAYVRELTGLEGRWMKLADSPTTVCDTGHNPGGWAYLVPQIASLPGRKHVVIGFVADKDVSKILAMIAERLSDERFYFVAPDSHRALPAAELQSLAAKTGLTGEAYPDVESGCNAALTEARKDGGSVFVGGSNYVVAELLAQM